MVKHRLSYPEVTGSIPVGGTNLLLLTRARTGGSLITFRPGWLDVQKRKDDVSETSQDAIIQAAARGDRWPQFFEWLCTRRRPISCEPIFWSIGDHAAPGGRGQGEHGSCSFCSCSFSRKMILNSTSVAVRFDPRNLEVSYFCHPATPPSPFDSMST